MLQFEECLKRELALVQKDRSSFIKEFSESDYNAIEAGWKVSIVLQPFQLHLWGKSFQEPAFASFFARSSSLFAAFQQI